MGHKVKNSTVDFEGLKIPEHIRALELEHSDFPLWDILKELDRRERRSARDKGKVHEDRGKSVREYMRTHPEEVKAVRQKYNIS